MKNIIRTMILLPALTFILQQHLCAQQIPVFSTYYFNKFLVNPAFTGIDNEYRVFGVYRTQWSDMPGRPVTLGGTVEGSFWKDRIGAGVYVMNDRTGIFNRTSINASYAQKIQIGTKGHQLSVGIQAGAFMNRIDFNSATVKDANDPELAAGTPRKTVFDMNVGLSYKWKGLLIGFAIPNILQPNAAYAAPGGRSEYQYLRHYVGYASYRITTLHEQFNITPVAMVRTAALKNVQVDASLLLDYKNIAFIGAGYRTTFGASVMAGANILNMFTIAYAYDITTQKVISGQAGATHEILAGFHIGTDYKTRKQQEAARIKAEKLAAQLQQTVDSTNQVAKAQQQSNDSLSTKVSSLKKENQLLKKQIDSLRKIVPDTKSGKNKKGSETGAKREAAKPFRGVDDNAIGDNDANSNNSNNANYSAAKAINGGSNASNSKGADANSLNGKNNSTGNTTTGNGNGSKSNAQTFTLDKIFFERNKYELLPESIDQLDLLVNYLRKHPKLNIVISGYTDGRGTDEHNQWLSEERAKAVAEYLLTNGISVTHIAYEGHGSADPVDDNSTDEGRMHNRRVEFTITNN